MQASTSGRGAAPQPAARIGPMRQHAVAVVGRAMLARRAAAPPAMPQPSLAWPAGAATPGRASSRLYAAASRAAEPGAAPGSRPPSSSGQGEGFSASGSASTSASGATPVQPPHVSVLLAEVLDALKPARLKVGIGYRRIT
jgi:hypothetical protein